MKIRKLTYSLILIALLLPLPVVPIPKEYKVKAVFLERLTRFIEWPKESPVHDASKPFVIAVIGKNPFGLILEQLYSIQRIKNKKVEIRYISQIYEIKEANILFIAGSKRNELGKIVAYTRGRPILTIGDTRGFTAKGVLINFEIHKNKVRFTINNKAAKKTGLQMSHLLLKMAKKVY
ncbi:MAG: YfiR family protein [bacterium]|nr:YfiR family protein [bacterium]